MKNTTFPFPTIMPASIDHQTMAAVRARLNTAIKEYREELHQSAKDQGIGIVHIYTDGEKGGLTIAYRKSNEFTSGCMVEVAVATCSEADAFSKKIGVQLALEKFFDDNTIELPLLKTFEARDVSYAVKSAFTAMYYSM